MIRVQVLAPFRYEYGTKRIWLTTGESMYLNPKDSLQREELKYLLSSKFPFKQYIYIDMATLDQTVRREVGEEGGFYKVEDPYPYPLPEEVCPTVPASFTAPYQEPEENSIFLNPVVQSRLPKIEEGLRLEPATPGLDNVSPIEDCGEEEECEPCNPKKELREKRRKELNHSNWNKVKGIAESYGIEYNNKAETIEAILEQEFGEE